MSTLSALLSPVIKALDENDANFNRSLTSPVNHGEQRIALLTEGLLVMAAFFDFPAKVDYISTGDFSFSGDRGRKPEQGCAPFGDALAGLLNRVPTRTGTIATLGGVMAENGWLMINHFEAENLLREIT